ncbi:spore germination protein GerPE [Paenibacillus septentrionalis]|uniref:Spore germination protein GerPE n=1 Tax=Paenibacillus septentrionalis TaxID=429342 RepID=A0ABW1V0Y4_9BACL
MSMNTLVSVKLVDIISNSTSGIVQFGDRQHSYLHSQSFSIVRNNSNYGPDEPYFERYPLFTRPLPKLEMMLPSGSVEHNMIGKLVSLPNQPPTIEVDKLIVISNSQSANVQLGNSMKLVAENRQKAIEQYMNIPKGARTHR